MGTEDGRTVDELFARLPAAKQRALEENGLGLPQLRRIAEEDGDLRRVRLILAFDEPGHPQGTAGVWPWIRLPLIAVAGVVVCLASTYLLDRYAVLVGLVWGLLVIWAALRAPLPRGGVVVRCLVGVAYVVLVWLGSQQADSWYLQVRGQETTVTYAAAVDRGSHGVTTLYCRVRLPDGSIHQVVRNDDRCTDPGAVGTRTRAVVDPAGHYRPFLGQPSDIGGGVYDYLCLGAAAVLLLAPAAAVALSRRPRNQPMTGVPA